MRHPRRDSLAFLYQLQFFGVKLGLDNIRALLDGVGRPQDDLRIIHIAGTNGKGSTAAALANIFQAAGLSAGLYTSPHLHCFAERIRIDLRPINDAELCGLIEELRPLATRLRATFFELSTALALLSFRRHGVDWAILETGMGGRLDATNLVEPELCLLTSIALDHAVHLGNDLAAIAAEKAGILKPGVPLISVPQPIAAEQVIVRRATAVAAPLLQLDRDFCWSNAAAGGTLTGGGYCISDIRPGLAGDHQQQNLALAGAAAAWLGSSGEALSAAAIKQGLEQVRWPGRLEWLPGRILLDGAHNQAGAERLCAYLQAEKLTPVHLIVGCKADKDYAALLASLLPCCGQIYTVPAPVDDAVAADALARLALHQGLPATAYERPETALAAAQQARGPEETLVVAGSLFLVAALRERLVESESLDICV